MLNPQFVAGKHGLFGGHKSEDIRTFLNTKFENLHRIFLHAYASCKEQAVRRFFLFSYDLILTDIFLQ